METEVLAHCTVCDSIALEVVDSDCNITRCRACGYVFDNPRPTLNELIRFYSRPMQYDSWLLELEARNRVWQRRASKLPRVERGSLLDVGTGIGQLLAVARTSYDEVYGTEVSDRAIKLAKELYNLDLFQGTIEHLSLERTFDTITMFHVLEHVPDPRVTLAKCHSLLADQGILIIAVPNEIASLRNFGHKILAKMGVHMRPHIGKFGLPRIRLDSASEEVHLSHFTRKVLFTLLERAGFTVINEDLDPVYLVTGIARLRAEFYYYTCLAILRVFRMNIYDTMLVMARKQETPT